MICHMRKGSNRLMAEYAAAKFRQQEGIAVYVKNGDGKFILAVIGDGNIATDGIAGIGKVEPNDDLFFSRRQEFVLAEEYFRE